MWTRSVHVCVVEWKEAYSGVVGREEMESNRCLGQYRKCERVVATEADAFPTEVLR